MVEWNAYRLERVYKVDRHGKPKLDGHREELIGVILADDKTEAQLLIGAMHGTRTFVCSRVSDKQHLTVARAS